MPLTAYIQKMTTTGAQRLGVHSDELHHFKALLTAVGAQLRPPFVARHSAATTASMLAALWPRIRQRQGNDIIVHSEDRGSLRVVYTLMPDQPFIVDTVRLAIQAAGGTYVGSMNAVVPINRDDSGLLVEVNNPAAPLESIVAIECEGFEADEVESLTRRLHGQLRLSQAMVEDFHAMTDAIDSVAYRFGRLSDRTPDQGEDLRETAEFLRWLLSDNFVFMGLISGDSRLGITRPDLAEDWDASGLTEWAEVSDSENVRVRKGRQESPAHRAGRIDEIRVEVPTTSGEARVIYIQGLFTYRAVTQPSRHVPLLRRALADILRNQSSKPGSYRYKGIANVFDSLPTEFLFTASTLVVTQMVDRVLEAEQEHSVRAHLVQSQDGDSTFVLAAMPRACWSEALRHKMEELLLQRTGASYADHGVFVGRYQTMLVHFYLTGSAVLDDAEMTSLRDAISELATPWSSRLMHELMSRHGEDHGTELVFRYGSAFENIYEQVNSPERTARDIDLLERLSDDNPVEVDLFRDKKGRVNLRIFQAKDILLSDILPVLDDFGLVVIDQFADEVLPNGLPRRTIDTFRLKPLDDLSASDLIARGDLLENGLRAVFGGAMVVDPLNRVLLRAGISWEAVDLIRAYLGYARQLGLRYTNQRVQEILLHRPELVRSLWTLFRARFDPDLEGDRSQAMAAANDQVTDGLLKITNHDQDLVFNTLFNLMSATLRTNFFRTDRVEHYISLKFDCSQVKAMQPPKLRFEIYVHHREVEGVHLRGGKVARGGIRWSDREDYRREILDLATTQMVKNVLIVPEGAKGGFFIKHLTGSRAEKRATADRLYKVLIRGMLDLTDNIVNGGIVHPPRVVFHDEDDPYLVVAADKGTAHLSDTANALSREYGFWLDDAFASGGSNGYDHKKVGITARGGWMTVRRLFREMGIDAETDEFTCVGIGDPSGDVFGNGVIEHRKLKLVAAFNHLHIFFDPNPDIEAAYAERERLFREAKGWEHYDTSKLSEGGGIFSRQAKSVKLTPEIQELLGSLKDELPVDVVIRLILRLNVDLLWNGGIGTYVKASHQSHRDAGDPTNDELRVNADELRARAVGEGGNLGFTQAARIEYEQKGGRINTDFIDNSGGVDMSDHEVNLKILLNPLVAAKSLGWEERNVLLEELTDQVAADVLSNNERHGLQLSLDQVRSSRDPMRYSRIIDWITQKGGLSRAQLGLPSDDDLKRRAKAKTGLTRPELAVIQAHVKMHVFKELEASDPALVPGFEETVFQYFPPRIRSEFAEGVRGHMLYNAIGMTVALNRIVGDAGAHFFPLVHELTGRPFVEIARAWHYAMELVGAEDIRNTLASTDTSFETRYRAWNQVTRSAEAIVSLWLAPGEPGPDTEDLDTIRAVLDRLPSLEGTVHHSRLENRVDVLMGRDLPQSVANKLALLDELPAAREIARIVGKDGIDSASVRYLAVGQASRLLPAIQSLQRRTATSGWDPVAISILRTRYVGLLRSLVDAVDLRREIRLGVDRAATIIGRGQLRHLRELVDHIIGNNPGIPALLVAEERIGGWIHSYRQGQASS